MKQTMKIKICGLTMPEEIAYIIDNAVEYCGMVLFFPKSKRNLSIERAAELINELQVVVKQKSTDGTLGGASEAGEVDVEAYNGPKIVAVTVSPTAEQVSQITKCGFNIIQIHGELRQDVLDTCEIPIIRAYNSSDIPDLSGAVNGDNGAQGRFCDIPELNRLVDNDKICGFLFDASAPGSGKTFDYELLREIKLGNKLFVIAGGLNPSNVTSLASLPEGITPDIVDTSSGVENDNGIGKDPMKIKAFVEAVRAI